MTTSTLPEGSVTFLMTDVEGSIPSWEADPEGMSAAMRLHDEVIEHAIADAGGVVIKPRGEGDSRFCVFAHAPSSVVASLAIQRSLAAVTWPTPRPIRVRIAIYTGHAESRGGDYYGSSVNRCARLRDLGHGGQVLLSASAAAAVGEDLPDKSELIPLGRHRLRGVELPEPIQQLRHPDIGSIFPPLRSGAPGNVPEPLTAFVGRGAELDDVSGLLDVHRLVTLTGAAGVGKTRMALEMGRRRAPGFDDGVWLVDLARVRDRDGVLPAVVGTFGLLDERERSVEQVLADYIRDKNMLVVMDNCEHLLDESGDLVMWFLRTSRRSSIIATSREPLGAAGETIWRVPSMSIPASTMASLEEAAMSDAVALFMARAASTAPDFVLDDRSASAVAHICRRLDGIPLAIELAAGKLDVLDVAEIERGVEDRFALLTGGPRSVLGRQQTMRAAVDYSYELLPEPHRALIRRLAVFVGGFSRQAAITVCGSVAIDSNYASELIASLVRKSLVNRDPSSTSRYGLLETIRAYGMERLDEAGELEQARAGHLGYYADLAAEAAAAVAGGPDQQTWLEQLALEHGNLLTALSFATAFDPDAGLSLAADIAPYWLIRGHFALGLTNIRSLLDVTAETSRPRARASLVAGDLSRAIGDLDNARAHLDACLSMAVDLEDRGLVARATSSLGMLAHLQTDYAVAEARFQEAAAAAREVGDLQHVGIVLGNLGVLRRDQRQLDASRAFYEESLEIARASGDRRQVGVMIGNLGGLAIDRAEYALALAQLTESLAIAREFGDRGRIALVTSNLGVLARARGDHSEARARYEEALAIAQELGDRAREALVVGNLGAIANDQGDHDVSERYLERSLAIASDLGNRRQMAVALSNLGIMAKIRGDHATATDRYEQAREIFGELGDSGMVGALTGNLGSIALARRDLARAQSLFDEALASAIQHQDQPKIAMQTSNQGLVAQHRGDVEVARDSFERSMAMWRELGDRARVADDLSRLGALMISLDDPARARAHFDEALPIARELGAGVTTAACLLGLGALALREGDDIAARRAYGECLDVAAALEDPEITVPTLLAWVELMTRAGSHEEACVVLGAAEASRERASMPSGDSHEDRVRALREPLLEAVGRGGFDRAVGRGRSMDDAQALAFCRTLR